MQSNRRLSVCRCLVYAPRHVSRPASCKGFRVLRRLPPPLPLQEAPFGAPPTPSAVKPKSVCITVERIIKFKETPGCLARAIHASEHDKDPKIAVSAEDVAHEFDAAEAGEPAPSRPGASFFGSAPATAATSQGEDFWVFKENANCLVRYHIMPRQNLFTLKEVEDCPVSPERFTAARTTRAVFRGGKADNIRDGWFGSRPNRSLGDSWTGFTVFKLKPIQSDCVITTGAAVMLESVPPTPLTEASKNGRPGTLPVFGMPCSAEQFVVGNHRARQTSGTHG